MGITDAIWDKIRAQPHRVAPESPVCLESHDAGGPRQLVASGCGGHHGGWQDPRHKDQDGARRPRGLSIRVPGRCVAWCSSCTNKGILHVARFLSECLVLTRIVGF